MVVLYKYFCTLKKTNTLTIEHKMFQLPFKAKYLT